MASLVCSALAYQVPLLHRRPWVWVTRSKIKALDEMRDTSCCKVPGYRKARRSGPVLAHDERFLDPSENETRTKIIILEDWFAYASPDDDVKDSACILQGATLGQDSVARRLAKPRYNILGTRRRAVLGCVHEPCFACAAPLECSVIPDLLEISFSSRQCSSTSCFL